MHHFYVEAVEALPADEHRVRIEFAHAGGGLGKGGQVTLYVDGNKVGEGAIPGTQALVFSAEGCDFGEGSGAEVGIGGFPWAWSLPIPIRVPLDSGAACSETLPKIRSIGLKTSEHPTGREERGGRRSRNGPEQTPGGSRSLAVACRQGPTVLDLHVGVRRDAHLAAERPIERDDQHDDKRQRGGDCAGHGQMQAKAFEAEQISEGCGQRAAEGDYPPNHHRYVAGGGGQARFSSLVELIEDAQEFRVDNRLAVSGARS